MIFEQFYLESLGHASYLVGDEKTGRALLLDPRRDVEVYLESARMHGLRIAYAIDTHGHNDYLSGLSELRLRQDMEVLGFAGADLGYDHRSVTDGEVIEMGDLAFEVIHTPGHSPEHVSLLVYDHARGADPVLLLAGGALLVGDVGRPDLLGSPDDVAAAARASCRTIRRLLCRLGDHVAVYPTHVRGSLCGGNIGSRLSTTVGYERRTNPTLSRIGSSEECLDESLRLDHLPAVPPYWRRMRAMNLSGPPAIDLWEPPALVPSEFRRHRDAGAIVVDARSPEGFAGGHIPGALNVGLGSSFSTWAGTILPEVQGSCWCSTGRRSSGKPPGSSSGWAMTFPRAGCPGAWPPGGRRPARWTCSRCWTSTSYEAGSRRRRSTWSTSASPPNGPQAISRGRPSSRGPTSRPGSIRSPTTTRWRSSVRPATGQRLPPASSPRTGRGGC